MLQFNKVNQNELRSAAKKIISFLGDEKVVLFYGEMGAGKTTFIKEICKELGVSESVTSPTYSIVNQYIGVDIEVYHFDFYRLKNPYEALDIGLEEYLSSGNYCFIEWPEKIANLLPDNYVEINISIEDNKQRNITAVKSY